MRAAAVEIHAVVADVGEHAVEHHADAELARLLAQRAQRLFVAKHRVDAHVVAGVVFVVGAPLEDRVKVEHGHAQLLEVGKLLAHALEGTAVEVVGEVVAVFGDVEEGHLVPLFVEHDVLPGLGVEKRVRPLAPEEAVDHDLVHHALVHPAGRRVVGVIDGDLEALLAAHPPLAAARVVVRRAEHDALPVHHRLKPVPIQAGRRAHGDLRLVIALAVAQAERAHREAMLLAVPHAQLDALQRLPAHGGKPQAHLRAGGKRPLREAVKAFQGVMLKNHGSALHPLGVVFRAAQQHSAPGTVPFIVMDFPMNVKPAQRPAEEFTFLSHSHCFRATTALYNEANKQKEGRS